MLGTPCSPSPMGLGCMGMPTWKVDPCLWDPTSVLHAMESGTTGHHSRGDMAGGEAQPMSPGHPPGTEKPAPGQTPVHGVEQDLGCKRDCAWPRAPWLDLSSSSGGKQRTSSCAQAPRRGSRHPLCPGHARVARAELGHGRGRREQPTREECAVAWEGGDHGKGMCCATARAGGAREEPAGRKNKLRLSQSYRAAVLLVAIFSFFPSPS